MKMPVVTFETFGIDRQLILAICSLLLHGVLNMKILFLFWTLLVIYSCGDQGLDEEECITPRLAENDLQTLKLIQSDQTIVLDFQFSFITFRDDSIYCQIPLSDSENQELRMTSSTLIYCGRSLLGRGNQLMIKDNNGLEQSFLSVGPDTTSVEGGWEGFSQVILELADKAKNQGTCL